MDAERRPMQASRGMSTEGVAGVAGIVFAIGVIVLGFVVYFDQPLYTDSTGDIREFFADNSTTLAVADWFGALLFVGGFLLFASGLRSVLRDERAGTWSRLSFAGAVVTTAVAGSGVFLSSLALGGLDDLPDGVVHAFVRADAILFTAILPWGFALFLAAAGIAMARSGVFARWLAWFGIVAAAALVIGSLWPIDGDPEGALAIIGYIAFFASVIWIVIVGFEMTRRRV